MDTMDTASKTKGGWNWLATVTNVRIGLLAVFGLCYQAGRWLVTVSKIKGGWNWLTTVTNVRIGLLAVFGLCYQAGRWLVTNSKCDKRYEEEIKNVCKDKLRPTDLFPVSLSVHKEMCFIGMWVTLDPVESHDNPLCQFPCGCYLLAWSVTYATP